MNDVFDSLPWLLAALAALLVGGAKLVAGALVWDSLEYAGSAFVIFGIIGAVVRKLLAIASLHGAESDRKKSDAGRQSAGNDQHDGRPTDESR